MEKQTRWIVVLILLLSLVALACQGLSAVNPSDNPPATEVSGEPAPDDSAAVDVAAEAPAEDVAAEAPADEPAADEAEGPLDLSAIDTSLAFDSYRYSVVMTIEETSADGTAVVQTINGEVAVTTDPAASTMTFQVEGGEDTEGLQSVSMTVLEGETYMIIPEFGCVTTGQLGEAFENPFQEIAQPDTLLNEIGSAERVLPDETINGILSRHYTFDESAIDDPEAQIDTVDGHLYIAADGGFLVRMTMLGTGALSTVDDAQEGTGIYSIEWNLLEVDGDIEITLPPECEGNTTDGFPQLEDATEVSAFAGFMSYKSGKTLAEAQEFYLEALQSEGWTYDDGQSFIGDDTAIMVFTRGEETLNVTMGTESADAIYVLLTAE